MLALQAIMDVKIEKLVYGGEGLGHSDGHTVFVPFVLPDEVVAVRALEQKKKFVRGRVERVLEASPQRAQPPCQHFGVCGGCHYQHIPYEAQLEYKAAILRETLWRIGRVKWEGPVQTHASPPLGYRNRAQWKIRASADGKPAIGYYQAGSSTLSAAEECPILSPRLAETLGKLRQLLAEGKLPGALGEVEAFADAAEQTILLNASGESFHAPAASVAAALRQALPRADTILLQETKRDHFELFGPGFIHYEVAGTRYRVGHLSFFQVNRYLVEELLRAVVAEERGALALDLFAGVGLFTLPLARQFERVVGVESDVAAARDLQANIEAERSSAQQADLTVESFLASWKETPELVVLDPPRAGVAENALKRLVQLAPERIRYLSCDPSTLARDLAALTGVGAPYEIREVHLFDLFPQTYHIETLAVLGRRS